jgi:FtsZ-binding cell division protein ZapB
MISEFHQLAEKISSLAALTQTLRQENAGFRQQIAALTEVNAQLNEKIDVAAERISQLLAQFPEIAPPEEVNKEETV